MQFGAVVAVVECVPRNEHVWRARLESRAKKDGAAQSQHKPATWDQLQHLLAGCIALASAQPCQETAPDVPPNHRSICLAPYTRSAHRSG